MAAPLGMLCHAAGRGKETAPALLGLVRSVSSARPTPSINRQD